MSDQRVADMTVNELKAFIEQIVDERLEGLYKKKDQRTVQEINESIRRHRWTPPLGSPSTLEMIREDRDR